MGNTYNRVYIWCCKYGENRYCERCANKKLCASKHTGLLNSCLGKLCLHPYLVVPLISARVTLISTRVSAHCQAILLPISMLVLVWCKTLLSPFVHITDIPEVPQSCINSLAPGKFQFNFRKVIFKLTLVNGGWGTSYQIAFRWMPQDVTDDKSTLVQVMAWCRQATSHYLSQCWPRSMSPNGVTTPQRVSNNRHVDQVA